MQRKRVFCNHINAQALKKTFKSYGLRRIIFGSHVSAEGALKVCVYLRAMKRDNRTIILMPSVSEAEENFQILGRT